MTNESTSTDAFCLVANNRHTQKVVHHRQMLLLSLLQTMAMPANSVTMLTSVPTPVLTKNSRIFPGSPKRFLRILS